MTVVIIIFSSKNEALPRDVVRVLQRLFHLSNFISLYLGRVVLCFPPHPTFLRYHLNPVWWFILPSCLLSSPPFTPFCQTPPPPLISVLCLVHLILNVCTLLRSCRSIHPFFSSFLPQYLTSAFSPTSSALVHPSLLPLQSFSVPQSVSLPFSFILSNIHPFFHAIFSSTLCHYFIASSFCCVD